MLELLKDKIYIRYYLAVVVSFLGDAMTVTTVLYLVGKHTNSPIMLGLVLVAQLLPPVIIGPFTGPLIDKYSTKKVMMISDILRSLIVICMIFFYQQPTQLIMFVLLLGIGSAFFEPARMASIPSIVGIDRIPKGIALFQTTMAVIKLAGPVIAGILLAVSSPFVVFILDAISYLISAIFISSLSVLYSKENSSAQLNSYLKSLKTGLIGLLNKPILRFLLILLIPVLIGYGIFLTNFKAVMLQVFYFSNVEFGIIEGVHAFGSIIGATIGSFVMPRIIHYRLLNISITFLGLGIVSLYGIILAQSLDSSVVFTLFVIWSLIIGCTNAFLFVPTSSIFLQYMPNEIRGRGIAIFYAFINLFLMIGTLLGGLLAPIIGVIESIIVSGGICLLTTIYYPLLRKSVFMKRVREDIKQDL
ncbi:hypothetical protein CJ195_08840 [Bacillus sp. UMB0899]|nr:hypothetical protein CJ195_08840 [Bacillus sp. UMB0899]